MSIIEKLIEDLIIITLDQIEWEFGRNVEYYVQAEIIEQQRNELLEALIDTTYWQEKESIAHNWDEVCPARNRLNRNIDVIEEVTGKPWEEIKQIVDKETR